MHVIVATYPTGNYHIFKYGIVYADSMYRLFMSHLSMGLFIATMDCLCSAHSNMFTIHWANSLWVKLALEHDIIYIPMGSCITPGELWYVVHQAIQAVLFQ